MSRKKHRSKKKYREKLSASYMAARSWHYLTAMERFPISIISAGADRGMNVHCLIPRMKMEQWMRLRFL